MFMKNLFFAGALGFAALSHASTTLSITDFSPLSEGHQGDHGGHGSDQGKKIMHCAHHAWMAAQTSADQNQSAKELLLGVRAVVIEHKDGIKSGVRNLLVSWAKHPVSKDEIGAAEMALHEHIVPVKNAVRDAFADILNLLSVDQRGAFDRGFINCLQRGDENETPVEPAPEDPVDPTEPPSQH